MSALIEELLPAATLAAQTQGIALTVMPVEGDLTIEADRQVLAAVLTNVLQNALQIHTSWKQCDIAGWRQL